MYGSVCVHRILSISAPMRGDEGVYQCVGQQGGDGSTAITSSSYVNIQCEYTELSAMYSHHSIQCVSAMYSHHSIQCVSAMYSHHSIQCVSAMYSHHSGVYSHLEYSIDQLWVSMSIVI